MKKEELQKIIDNMTVAEIQQVQEMINRQKDNIYHKKENFMIHEKIDNYLYELFYDDGEYHTYFIGAKAWKEYNENKRAVSIWRKSKDLFPTRELLVQKV